MGKNARVKANSSKTRGASRAQGRTTGQSARPVAAWRGTGEGRRLVLRNRHCEVELWPEFGGAITGYRHLASGLDVIWRNPQVQPPRRQVLAQPVGAGSDLFDVMDGSWYVSVPNGFFPASYFGAPLGTHGELRAVPWEVTEMAADAAGARVTLVGRSIRTPLVYRRTLRLTRESPLMSWRESLHNRSARSLPVAWLQHPTFGGPLLRGARLVTPARTVAVFAADDPAALQLRAGYRGRWPHVPERVGGRLRDCSVIPPEGSGTDHSVQLGDFPAGWGCVWNEGLGLGFALEWEREKFPYAWSWNSAGGAPGYPMWGQGHLITLQPSTSPVGRFDDLVKQGAVLTVPAHGEVATELVTGFVDRSRGPWSRGGGR